MLLASTARRTVATTPGLGRRAASALALKYSKAVFGAARAQSPQTLNKVATELTTIGNTIKTKPEVGEFIRNPTIAGEERIKAVEALLSTGKKEQVSDITKNFFNVLAENGRLGETEGIIEGFNELVAQERGELTVTVTSATPLPKDVLSRLETSLKQSQTAQSAKVLKLNNKVNPTVLGGLIIDFGDKTIDLSVQSRVTKLNNVLTQSV
ncbi:OSCP/delta subunit of ATPase [Crucibulum laeve]|uniref:ATP synthase subunit 5, mitochondrial n=1 Tax=Crucibulum laeve TaxID=68775 RepID=A0A5C3MFW0_9AGAR|nr:OSCP/delta subunit of ATPase [Crucibulum laeve]